MSTIDREALTPERRAELRRLCEAATTGPWKTGRPPGGVTIAGICDTGWDGFSNYRTRVWAERVVRQSLIGQGLAAETDAAFIAESRTALPACLDALDECERKYAAGFWRDWVYPYGATAEQVHAELTDYHFLMEQAVRVYYDVTGGLLSKTNYYAESVIAAAHDHLDRCVNESISEARVDANARIEELERELRIAIRELTNHAISNDDESLCDDCPYNEQSDCDPSEHCEAAMLTRIQKHVAEAEIDRLEGSPSND